MSARLEGIFEIDDLNDYRERVRRAHATIQNSGWGSQSQCAAALGEQNITISQVLRGIRVDIVLLEAIEKWIHKGSQAYVGGSGWAGESR